jgi:CheY-like chemotaxis protein
MSDSKMNIAIVLYQYSVVVKGMEKKLVDLGYKVDIIADKYEQMIKTCAPVDSLFIVYLPNDIIDSHKLRLLQSIIQTVKDNSRKLILIGEKDNQDEVAQAIPAAKPIPWISRPVDIAKLSETIETISNGKRILIVDDDPSYAKMVREWIKDQYRVDVVTAGMQAITFLMKVPDDDKVDLILLDYEMPIVDGPQVLQMLRQEPATKDIPVVFLTGNGTKEAVQKVMALKPNGYILKSTTRDNLLEYIANKLN